MTRKPISPDLVGLEFPVTKQTWSSKDTMLYALGVGARPARDLDYIYEGRGPKVLPTYAVIPGGTALDGMMRAVEMRLEMLLHGEQSIELFRPLPPEASVEVTGRITEVWDKGKAAVLGVESLARDADGDLFRTRASLFVRGAGGFGGERGPSVRGATLFPSGRRTSLRGSIRALNRARSTGSPATATPFASIRSLRGWAGSKRHSCMGCAPMASWGAPSCGNCAPTNPPPSDRSRGGSPIGCYMAIPSSWRYPRHQNLADRRWRGDCAGRDRRRARRPVSGPGDV